MWETVWVRNGACWSNIKSRKVSFNNLKKTDNRKKMIPVDNRCLINYLFYQIIETISTHNARLDIKIFRSHMKNARLQLASRIVCVFFEIFISLKFTWFGIILQFSLSCVPSSTFIWCFNKSHCVMPVKWKKYISMTLSVAIIVYWSFFVDYTMCLRVASKLIFNLWQYLLVISSYLNEN